MPRYPWAVRAGGPLLGGGTEGPAPFLDFNPVGGGGVLPSSIFTRTTTGLYFDGTQFLSAAIDTPRFQTFSGIPRHFLREPLGANALLNSADPTTKTPQAVDFTNLGNQSINLNGYRMEATSAFDFHGIVMTTAGFANQPYCISVILKDEDVQFAYIRGPRNSASSEFPWFVFDLTNQTIQLGGAAEIDGGEIYDLDNGFRQIVARFTTAALPASTEVWLMIDPSGTLPADTAFVPPSYAGSGESIIFCNAQEERTPYWTSPIITGGSAVARGADQCFDAAWPVEAAAVVDVTVNQPIPLAAGAVNDLHMLGFGSNAANTFSVDAPNGLRLSNGGINSFLTAATPYEFERHGYGMSLKANEGIVVDDENNDNTDVTGTPSQGAIFWGAALDLSGIPCYLHRARIYDQTLTVAELKALV